MHEICGRESRGRYQNVGATCYLTQKIRALPFQNRSYVQLTEAGCRAAGVPREMARPLRSQGLIEHFALLWLCSIEPDQPRVLINPGHYDSFDVDPNKLRRVHFYLEDSDDDTIIGFVQIDHGTTSRRLIQKTIARIPMRLPCIPTGYWPVIDHGCRAPVSESTSRVSPNSWTCVRFVAP